MKFRRIKLCLRFLSCLAVTSAAEAQTSAPKPPVNCTVQGLVVQQPGGLPIRKADVRLSHIGDDDVYSSITDAEGRFKMEDVKPGQYRISADRQGFVFAENHKRWNGVLYSLEPGQEVKDLLLHMTPAAVITGKITDIDGDPVPNASVEILPLHIHRNIVPIAKGYGSTNDLGEYRISGLLPDRYLIVASSIRHVSLAMESADTGRKPIVYGTTYFPGTTDRGSAVPLAVRAGDEVLADIRLAPTSFFRIRGEVSNVPAEHADEASVVLGPLDDGYVADIRQWPLDKSGKFEIRGVLPGSYRLFVMWGSGFDPAVMRADQTVQGVIADVEGLRISALANGVVRGRFRMDDDKKIDWSSMHVNLSSTRSRRPLGTGIQVDLASNAFFWDDLPAHAEVKSDGSFEMKAVAPDNYWLRLWSSDKVFDPYFPEAVKLEGKDVSDSGFTTGGGTYSLDIVMNANGASIDGVVLDDQNKPASDVSVVIVPDAAHRQRRDLYNWTRTDSRGHFNEVGLNPGDYQVFAIDEEPDEDDFMDPEFARAHEPFGLAISLKEGQHKSIGVKLTPSAD